MKPYLLIGALLLGTALVVLPGCGQKESSSAEAKKATFHCPMHPTYVDSRASDCPICGMRLVPIKGAGGAASAENQGEQSHVPGRVAISVSPEKRQTIGLMTSTVEARPFNTSIRATATVTHDETKLVRIAPRFGGWVRKLHVNYTGQAVKEGEPLFTVYSPELFTAENEYLLAIRNLTLLSNSPAAGQKIAQGMVDSSRRRLELLQIGADEIRQLETSGKASDELLIRSPVSGHVLTKNAVEGKSFMPGDTLYEIADLGHLWLRTAVFEYEMPQVRVGQKARVTFPYLGNKVFESEVTFISPHIDPQTRRAEVRLEIDNPEGLIRPDMWATVELLSEQQPVLAVPASAVIDTGARHIAFVDRPDQHLEPREVKTGARTDEYIEVLSGLKEGEKVVTRALFMVDSESQLKAAIAGMTGDAPADHSAHSAPSGTSETAPQPQSQEHQH